ncbi:MAG TPA: archaemetzincin family Zn-dependent metalloprotease [Desulfomonilaceae bacterium]|nr:archaemetzincin family Zn-dependent metalloprotease [Desulfomonilaceae bacterium]
MKKKKTQQPVRQGLITVIPLGKVGEDVIRVVSDSLQGVLRLPVDVSDVVLVPAEAYMENRNQYNAMTIIRHLNDHHSRLGLKVLGVTSKDLGNPILTYVFGEAYMGGAAAVMSYHRLYKGPGDDPVSREQFLDRVAKVALHEIGHTFNVPHCHSGRCVMRASNSIMDLDQKLNYLCDYCELFLFEAVAAALKKPDVKSK